MGNRNRCAFLLTASLLLTLAAYPASSQCLTSIPPDEFRYRFGIAGGPNSGTDLLRLLEQPTIISATAVPADPGEEASTVATTEAHALYPISPSAMVEVLKDEAILPDIIPDLVRHVTICRIDPGTVKQMQRTEFNVLFLTFGTEYLIDVHYSLNGPDEYASYWGMYESLDGRLAFLYGSWYFLKIEIRNREYTYVRHFTQNGINPRVPGLRMLMRNRAGERVAEMMDAIYHEAVRRHGRTPLASLPAP